DREQGPRSRSPVIDQCATRGAPQPVPRKRGASPVRLALRKRMRKNLESLLERDMKGRSTPFLMVPEAIFVRQEGILKGYLRAGSFNATYTDETF
ncbi:hypothetical protein ACLOJK_041867, partial [Asimina triloba]